MQMTDFFSTVGKGETLTEQSTIMERDASAAVTEQKTEEKVAAENQPISMEAFESDLANFNYRAPKDLARLVNAEEVSEVKDVLSQLKNAELKIIKSDAADTIKEFSQKRIHMVRSKCNVKINRLKLENELQQQIAAARRQKNDAKAEELENQLKRARSTRRSEEYTDVQEAMKEEQQAQTLDKYSVYNQGAYGTTYTTNIYQDMSSSGSFINMSVGIKNKNK